MLLGPAHKYGLDTPAYFRGRFWDGLTGGPVAGAEDAEVQGFTETVEFTSTSYDYSYKASMGAQEEWRTELSKERAR